MTSSSDSMVIVPSDESLNCDVLTIIKEHPVRSDENFENVELSAASSLEKVILNEGILPVRLNKNNMNNNNDINLELSNYDISREIINIHDNQSFCSANSIEIVNGKCGIGNVKKEGNDLMTKCKLNEDSNIDVQLNETGFDSCTDFVGLELALTESNVKGPFLEEFCTKMGSVVKPPAGIEVKLQTLSKDDSTDNDVSYTDSLSPESDQEIGSSYVDSSYQQLNQEMETKYKNEIERLKWRVLDLEKEASHEFCQEQISTMEKAVQQLKLELDLSRQEHTLDARTFANERLELETKLENLKKEYQSANKDREAAVVRYACGEMELMNQKKEREVLEKKLKDFIKEKEVLVNKLKTLTSDKTRVCHMLDNKCSELSAAQKEIDSMKEEINSRDIKIKWLQNKLKTETDTRKELETKVEQLNGKVQEVLEEAEKVKHDAQESIKQFQESEDNKAYTLGQQLKEEQVKLMLIQHEQDENEHARKLLQHELDVCRVKLQSCTEESHNLASKVKILEKERLEYEQNLSQFKQNSDVQSKTIADLQHFVKDMEALRIQLQREQEHVTSSQLEMERLRTSNFELVQDMESCRKREADMLEFTQKLTAKNVRLQSEFTAVEAKVQQLECEEAPLQKKIVELENKVSSLLKEVDKERSLRSDECKVLARHLAEKTARIKTFEAQLHELTNEIQIIKRKDSATIKELNRELTQLRRRNEHNENGSGSDSLCQGSRTSSCTSLNEHSSIMPASGPASVPPSAGHLNLQVEPNRQVLIERIVKLQRDNAKAVEKIDFLEEHTQTLVDELKKKSKVLQSYVLREEAGALSSTSMDLNKAELAKHGGIMASVYGSKAVDDNMTLELSLEINQKLQAVLEDTLLKNITLKENIDTLGDEIARLNQKRHRS
ncbi:uncharacterized protein LOC142325537 [Lycorma delicatula]|uniref:uncharacterized protein LOC142325537 n=1 Tax=Lycorma delicatula TaxID=130591 RepID=UPI003F510C99